METFGKRLSAARKKAGLSQEKLANAVGVALMSISRYERDAMGVDDAVLERIAERLGTTAAWLKYGAQKPDQARESAPPSDELPPRLAEFLEWQPVTEPERRYLILQVRQDGNVDLSRALRTFRTPEHKRTPEAPATVVVAPEGMPKARKPARRP